MLIYPDPRLRLRAEPVLAFDAALKDAAQDLLDVLVSVSAIGLALPHIGGLQRIVVLRMEPGEPATTYVNPEIVWASPECAPQTEGSVSMPGVSDVVERAVSVRVQYRDLDGAAHEEEAEGFRAACLQHEIDQLDGIFWIDRLSRLRRERAVKRFGKLQRAAS
nr:peptide deformylase [Methylobacterium sp. BTF04]